METADPRLDGPQLLGASAPEPAEPVIVPPPLAAVVVTRNAGPWLEETLTGLRSSDYPSLTVLVLDTGSDEDPTPRIASVLPNAYVRRLEAPVGFAAAANEALELVEGAAFLLLCHDDVALDPPAIRLMVEEAYRSNAGIVGPKLVDHDHPDVLLEVGLAIDRFGVPYSGIEAGELDQEQHDGVRDVFYVSSAAMLVRTDLFAELHGFDSDTFPGGEDLDLCWRARLLGARVLVAPDARALHHDVAGKKARAEHADDTLLLRHRLRALFKSYSPLTLAWVVPAALALSLAESLAFVASRRGARARAVLGAWVWNLRRLTSLRAARREVQSTRRVRDSELRWLQFRGSARVRGFLADHVHPEDRIQGMADASRNAAASARLRLREASVVAMLAFIVVVVLGSRELILGRVPAVGSLQAWPGVTGLVRAFGSGWRYSLLGSPAPAPPAFALMAASGTVLLGATGLARTILVVAALPVGVIGAYRLARTLVRMPGPALAAGVVYGINPVIRNALAGGGLGPLVFYALFPFALTCVLRAARLLPGSEATPTTRGWHRARAGLPLVLLLACMTAFWPPALLVVVLPVAGLVLAVPLVGDGRRAVSGLATAVVSSAVALIVLFPWPLELLRPGGRAAAAGFSFRPALGLSPVLRFATGAAGAGAGGWLLLVAAGLILVIGDGVRLVWATRLWVIALVSFASVWVPSEVAPHAAIPAPEGLLVPAALALALAVGLGVGALSGDLLRAHFGWRQFTAVAAVGGLIVPALGFTADALDGRWHMPTTTWSDTLSWLASERSQGQFRVLWVGNPRALPLDASSAPGDVSYGLTRNGPGDARELWPAPGGSAAALVTRAVELARTHRTSRLGHLLAPMGVRYVAVPPSTGASGGQSVPPPAGLTAAFAQQLDLSRLESEGGLLLYENDAWAPAYASVKAPAEVPVGTRDPTATALATDISAASPVRDGHPVDKGTVLWAEAHDPSWRATSRGRALRHVDAFGWSNGYQVARRGPVSLSFGGQTARNLLVLVELGIVAGLVVVWRKGRGGADRRPDPTSGDGAGPPE